MRLLKIQTLKSSKYGNVIVRVFKDDNGKYRVALTAGGVTATATGRTVKDAVTSAVKLFKTNWDLSIRRAPIMFGADVDKYFGNNWKAVEQYVQHRNNTIAAELIRRMISEFKNNPPRDYNDFIEKRNRILQQIIAEHGGQIDWNNKGWQHTIDDIYRRIILAARKKKYANDWGSFYGKVRQRFGTGQGSSNQGNNQNNQNNNQHNQNKGPQPVDLEKNVNKAGGNKLNIGSVDEEKKNDIDLNATYNKLDQLQKKFQAMGRDDLATAVGLMKSEIEATKNARDKVLESYKQLMQNIQNNMGKLTSEYGAEKEFIDKWLQQKFGELKEKLQNLNQLAKDNLKKKLQLIQEQIANKSNILEGMQKKGKVSVGQELAGSAQVSNQFLNQFQKAYEDYFNQLRQNTQDYYNLYKTWLNELQQNQATWAKPLYDILYNQANRLYTGLHQTNENWLGRELQTAHSAALNAANLANAAKSAQLTEEDIKNKYDVQRQQLQQQQSLGQQQIDLQKEMLKYKTGQTNSKGQVKNLFDNQNNGTEKTSATNKKENKISPFIG